MYLKSVHLKGGCCLYLSGIWYVTSPKTGAKSNDMFTPEVGLFRFDVDKCDIVFFIPVTLVLLFK